MYICLPDGYNNGEIYGSWNNWKEPLNINECDFQIDIYRFYYIDTTDICISYKIKIDSEYKLINDYTDDEDSSKCNKYLTIKDGNFENNCIKLTSDGYYFNGIIKIKSYDKNKITIYKNDEILFDGNKEYLKKPLYGRYYNWLELDFIFEKHKIMYLDGQNILTDVDSNLRYDNLYYSFMQNEK
jgi:hypothetical protein